jgi:ABC-type transport system involved in multi-copper enzyme maturation permease subunit
MTTRENTLTSSSAVGLLTRALFLEALRRREFYGLLLFMGLYLVGALIVRIVGIEDAATAAFVLNLGLSMAFFLGLLMTMLLAVRAVPEEIEARTIYPVLAKPLRRSDFILGKWFAAWLTGTFTTVVLLVLGWLPAPSAGDLSAATFVQGVILQLAALAMLAALGLVLSIFLPKAVNVVILVLLILAGHRIVSAVRGQLPEAFGWRVLDWVLRYVPDFGILNLVDRYTDGMPPLSASDFLLRVIYAGLVTAVCLVWTSYAFERRAL